MHHWCLTRFCTHMLGRFQVGIRTVTVSITSTYGTLITNYFYQELGPTQDPYSNYFWVFELTEGKDLPWHKRRKWHILHFIHVLRMYELYVLWISSKEWSDIEIIWNGCLEDENNVIKNCRFKLEGLNRQIVIEIEGVSKSKEMSKAKRM